MKALYFLPEDRKSNEPEAFAKLTMNEMMLIRGGDATTDGTDTTGTKTPE